MAHGPRQTVPPTEGVILSANRLLSCTRPQYFTLTGIPSFAVVQIQQEKMGIPNKATSFVLI
jgi:hypothetical protein